MAAAGSKEKKMSVNDRKHTSCSRCGALLEFVRSELSRDEKTVYSFYACPRANTPDSDHDRAVIEESTDE